MVSPFSLLFWVTASAVISMVLQKYIMFVSNCVNHFLTFLFEEMTTIPSSVVFPIIESNRQQLWGSDETWKYFHN